MWKMRLGIPSVPDPGRTKSWLLQGPLAISAISIRLRTTDRANQNRIQTHRKRAEMSVTTGMIRRKAGDYGGDDQRPRYIQKLWMGKKRAYPDRVVIP